METDKLLDEIFEISRTKEGKTLQELTLKCSEEVGELAQAVLSYTGAKGCTYKDLKKEDVIEEIADVFLVNIAMASRLEITKEDLKKEIERKLNKWVEKMKE
jgi:NTP pyrophosphatase (non-canonical NTP hydrolase)